MKRPIEMQTKRFSTTKIDIENRPGPNTNSNFEEDLAHS